MEKHKREVQKERPLQWHPANYAGLQIELAEEKEFLNFEDEHQLGTKPMAIDILIIKNEQGHKMKGLTNRIKDLDLTTALAEDYQKHRKNTLYQSVMDIIIRANQHQFEEARKMCEAVREWIREEYADEIHEERKNSFNDGFNNGFDNGFNNGFDNGLQDGERRVNNLNLKLSELGRNDDILKAAIDPEYQRQLFKEFEL